MRVFQAVGIPCPESFLGFGVGGVEPTLASLRAKIMGALIVAGKESDVPGIESLSANGVYGGFRYRFCIGHVHPSLWMIYRASMVPVNVTPINIIPILDMAP
jgi:hypothetical protein